jgi:hypothetical protein
MTTQTRSSRRTFTWRLAAAVTGVAVLATGLSACSTDGSAPDSASSSASGAITESVDVKEAGIETDIAEFLGKSLVSGVVGAGGAKGFNSALAAIFGDPTTEALDTITSQLDAVTTQVAALQKDVTQLQNTVDTNYYNDVARNLEQHMNTINELQLQELQGIVDDAKALQTAKGTPGEATARTNLDNSKASFVRVYEENFAAYSAIAANIHEVLLPAGALTDKSILTARGQVLMDKGYVNSGDSDDLYRLQNTLAQEEALAVYLNAEYLVMSGKQAAADRLVTDWSNAQIQETAVLPPRIPTGAIVVTPNSRFAGALEFLPPTYLQDGTPQFYANVANAQVPAVVAANPGWSLPTNDQVAALTNSTSGQVGSTAAMKLAGQLVKLTPQGYTDGNYSYGWSILLGPTPTQSPFGPPSIGMLWTQGTFACNSTVPGPRVPLPGGGSVPTTRTVSTNYPNQANLKGASMAPADCATRYNEGGIVLVKPATDDYMAQG